MSGGQTNGFDLVYEISLAKFRDALAGTWLTDLLIRVTHVDVAAPVPAGLPVPGPATQTGLLALSPATAANVALTRTGGTTFTLVVTFPHALLSLDPIVLSAGGPIPTGGGSFLGVHGVDVGPAVLTVPLSIAPGITIAPTAPASVAPLNVSSIFANASIPPGTAAGFVGALQNAVGTASAAAIASAVAELLPIAFPIRLPSASAGPCGIGPIALTPQLVPAVAGSTVDALAFLVTAAGSSGSPNLPAVKSHLTPGLDADLLVGTELALRIVCCLFPRSPDLVGFPTTPSSMTATSCTFGPVHSSFSIASQQFDEMSSLTIAIGNGSIDISGTGFKVSATGWEATATFSISLGLRQSAGSLTPVELHPPVVSVDTDIAWWAYLLIAIGALVGAIIGFIIGGPYGAVAGGIIGALVGALIILPIALLVDSLGTLLSGTVGGALGAAVGALSAVPMLPGDVLTFFGTPALAGDPTIDDIRIPMKVSTPAAGHTVAAAYGVALRFGTWIDLDTGGTGTGTPPPGADLVWRQTLPTVLTLARTVPAGGAVTGAVETAYPGELAALDPARLQLIGAAAAHSFESISEITLAGFVYPPYATALPQTLIGNGVTFGVRTSAGRYAKCVAALAGTDVQLWFATYDTPVPLWVLSSVTTTRGPAVVTGGLQLSLGSYQVARDVVCTAHVAPPLTTAGPIAYRWFWNGTALGASGTLPGGATYFVIGARCELKTQMGAALGGTLCVTASTGAGFTVEACSTVRLAGSEGLADQMSLRSAVPPPPAPPPVGVGAVALDLDHAAANAHLVRALHAGSGG